MTHTEPARAPIHVIPSAEPDGSVPALGITIYGCGRDEAVRFRRMAPGFGIAPTITEAPLSESTINLAQGNRCISVGHKAPIPHATLSALSRAGVRYLCTRSIGYDHIDVTYAERVGISVDTVRYSPDSVADYTLMLMLMSLRHARSVLGRAQLHDYRLNDVPGKELRDLTVGVIGAGRIGSAVIDRLEGFGCALLTHDELQATSADHLPLDELLPQSDVVTLHAPLTSDTHHLLSRRRIEQMKHGAVVVNTGRGALLDTEALLQALESGRLGGAALDVLEAEEGLFYTDCRHRRIEHPTLLRLHRLPNVIISPHTAYYTERVLNDIAEHTLVNCRAFDGRCQDG